MRAAVIENGIVTNVVLVDDLDALPNLVDAADAQIGDLWDGQTFTRPAPVVSVPASISPAQARLALLGAGLLDQVEAAVAAADQRTQIVWAQATAFERNSATMQAMATSLGLSDAQLDALFIAGAAITI